MSMTMTMDRGKMIGISVLHVRCFLLYCNILYYYFLKGLFINLDLSEKVFVSDIKTAIQKRQFMAPAFFDMIAEFYIDLKNITAIEEVFFIRHLFNFLFFLVLEILKIPLKSSRRAESIALLFRSIFCVFEEIFEKKTKKIEKQNQ